MSILKSKIIFSLLVFISFPAFSANGSFSTVTYNVAGLLELFSSAITPRQEATEQISCYVNPFDIVNVQEDFNYHAALYDTCNQHVYRTPTTGGMGIGSGLNTMSYFPFSGLKRVRWNSCNGVDCLTPKGFTVAQVRLAEGVLVDVYNLHTQAQVEENDLSARRNNIQQLADYINNYSKGNAVIIMGDTNTRYTRTGDNIRVLTDLGFKDVWIDLIRSGNVPAKGANALVCDPKITDFNCEIVDKVLYINSKAVTLVPTSYSVHEDDVNSEGKKLSDHPPVVVDWNYTTSGGYKMSDAFGGEGGNAFNDLAFINTSHRVTRFDIRSGARVDAVNFYYSNGESALHGGTDGSQQSLYLGTNEYIKSLDLCIGERSGADRVFYAKATTNLGAEISGGTSTNDCKHFEAPAGFKLVGLHGGADNEVDRIGAVYIKQ